MEPKKINSSIVKAITALLVVGLGGLGLWKLSSPDKDEVTPAQPNDTSTTTTPITSGTYKDGTYSAVGNYNSPEGPEQISVSVTLKNGVITDSTFMGQSSEGTSRRYMDKFKVGFTTLVVGKSIDQVSLTVVNGSSLTPIGFMNALAKIKAQAKG